MAFNSHTYYANKYRRQAWAELAEARAIKARVQAGTAYDWEPRRIAHFVLLARTSMHLSLSSRQLSELSKRRY
jgi:hypothetical protein